MKGLVTNLNRNSFPVEVAQVVEPQRRKSLFDKWFGRKKDKEKEMALEQAQIVMATQV